MGLPFKSRGEASAASLTPGQIANLAAWYDVSSEAGTTSNLLRIDSSNRVSLLADRSGNSGTSCLCLNGVAGNYASVPDPSEIGTLTELELIFAGRLPDWTPSGAGTLVGKFDASGQLSFLLRVTATNLFLELSQNGTATTAVSAGAANTIPDFSIGAIKATWRASDGRVQFFQSTGWTSPSSQGTWTQVGTNQTIALASIFDSTSRVTIGAYDNTGTSSPLAANVRYVSVASAIDGAPVFAIDFTGFSKLASTGTASTGATVTINSSGDLGARISGERDLVQLTASKQPVYLNWTGANYGYNGAINGNAFSTPDSVANSTTGDLEVIFDVTANDYSQAGGAAYAAKYVFSTNNRSWRVTAAATRIIQLTWSPDGTGAAAITAAFTDHGTANFTRQAFKVTLDVDNGAGGWTARLFKAPTYAGPWAQVGSDVTGAGVTSIFDSTAPLEVGSQNNLAAVGVTGAYHYFSVSGTINGAPVAIFDPSRYTSGTTFTASTGETWTLNGGATIVTATSLYFDGSDDYMKAAAFSLSQPETVYFVGQQVSWTANDYFFDGNTTNGGAMYQLNVSPQINIYAGTGIPIATTALQTGTTGIFTSLFNGASSLSRVNRLAATTGSIGTNGLNGFTLGAGQTAPTGFGNIRTNEVAIYAAAHDLATRDRFALYAASKWRISGV